MSINKKHIRNYFLILLVLIGSTLIISYFDWDIKLQQHFFDENHPDGWYQKNHLLWRWAYVYGPYPALLTGLVSIFVVAFSWFIPRLKNYRIYAVYFLLTLIIGPGLIINGILKDHWGRPRPRQLQEFGGAWEFREICEKGVPGKGKSFPCGHCSMGFVFIGLYFLLKRKNKALAVSGLSFSLAFGGYIGLARIAQGGHFLSDVIWSAGVTWLVAAILYYEILKIPSISSKTANHQKPGSIQKHSPWKTALVIALTIISLITLIFLFLFSKPAYKEYQQSVTVTQPFNNLLLSINCRNAIVFIRPANRPENVVQVQSVMRGFGYPKFKFDNQLTKLVRNDSLFVDYRIETSGLFYELELSVNIEVDSTTIRKISGNVSPGDLFVARSLRPENVIYDLDVAEQQIKLIEP
ncbi:MAG TPA: phosphatase PAP2 family protein [bacterium]|nr:phosphatase PAP2 family protein [bacterium]